MPPSQPPDSPSTVNISVLWAVLCGLACAVTLPLRYGEGLRGAHGRNGVFAVMVIVLYAVFVPCPPLLSYGVLFIGFAVVKRFTTLARHRFGNRQISGFEGWPLPCLIGLPYGLCKQVVEPAYVYAIGWYLRFSNPALGCFFIAGAAAAALKTLFEHLAQLNRDVGADDVGFRMREDARRRAKRGW